VNQLRSFYAAAKSVSITKASEELMVTPAANTAQVKQLEENLELRLLFRSGNSMLARYSPNHKKLRMRLMGLQEITLVGAGRKSTLLQRDEISVAELGNVPLIAPIAGSAVREIIFDYLAQFKVTPKVVIETDSIALNKRLLEQDKGVAFLCRDVVREELSETRLREIRVSERMPSLEYGIGYLNRISLSEASSAFIEMIKNA
jgi:DNA-binding transcriptional LysR family regulator